MKWNVYCFIVSAAYSSNLSRNFGASAGKTISGAEIAQLTIPSNQNDAVRVYHQNSSHSRLRIILHNFGSPRISEQFQINARTWWNKIRIDQKRDSLESRQERFSFRKFQFLWCLILIRNLRRLHLINLIFCNTNGWNSKGLGSQHALSRPVNTFSNKWFDGNTLILLVILLLIHKKFALKIFYRTLYLLHIKYLI